MRALIVRGGWPGHSPEEATDRFVPFLRDHFDVETADSLDAYLALDGVDLVVQCWSDGTLTDAQSAGLVEAVRRGMGLAGWHGGLVDAFRASRDYLQLTGGQFVAHPGGFVDHRVEVVSSHPIVEGIDGFSLHTEQYWVLSDGLNDVLATTTFTPGPDTPWREPVTVPAVWTRRWGAGRVFACTIGHAPADLDIPEVRTIIERGLLWAATP
ncbi:type 1 glutamine amidotransferase [Saccharothrix coeruleofusca]|uniref:ThuA domain-containing protein n=1 Tax=Saccharothrix coeruleofusca TaxID=33919 RepID=UPI001AE2978C|nr:ThuA domain-containing protein [Saccharothrix coeruleofusca]MBP2338916.1 type 1 glutamine amidotransferase [Saccharothrix coeruleofusca]